MKINKFHLLLTVSLPNKPYVFCLILIMCSINELEENTILSQFKENSSINLNFLRKDNRLNIILIISLYRNAKMI